MMHYGSVKELHSGGPLAGDNLYHPVNCTGLGITNYQIIEAVTFGGLSKLGAYQLHSTLLVPFLVVLAFHIGLTFMQNRQKRNINVA